MRARTVLSTAGLGGMAGLLAAASSATWYYASRIVEPPADAERPPAPAADRVRVGGLDGGRVWLQGPDAARRGVWGLAWNGGYGQVGPVAGVDGDHALREFTGMVGEPPAGVEALFEATAFPPDPEVLGLPWRQVSYRSPAGALPAWEFPGERDTWAILTHGRMGRRHHTFRLLRVMARLGLPCLAISYRNDPDAPRAPDGKSHLGGSEWEDVEAALVYALGEGASDVVLTGSSMGGTMVLNLLRVSGHAGRVRGVVLDAPVLDWRPVLRRAALERGVPGPLVPALLPVTMGLARARSRIDRHALRPLEDPDVLNHPKLLIQGDADPLVPVHLADALAAARPDLVTYLRVPGAGHGRSWNRDPATYEEAVEGFVTGLLEGGTRRRRGRRWGGLRR